MAAAPHDFKIRQHDTAPPLATQLTLDGAPLDLTAASVTIRIRHVPTDTLIVEDDCDIDDADDGAISYDWTQPVTTAGLHRITFTVTTPAGTMTVPNHRHATLYALPTLAEE